MYVRIYLCVKSSTEGGLLHYDESEGISLKEEERGAIERDF